MRSLDHHVTVLSRHVTRSSERVDWLYRGPIATNREEYLLGKRIDKSVDQTLIEEEREKEVGVVNIIS